MLEAKSCRKDHVNTGIATIASSCTLKTETEATLRRTGQWCGSVGRAVASDSRGPRFESSHWKKCIFNIFTVNCVEKMKNKEKEAGIGPFFKTEAYK